ncbi:type III-A CRISPR-associated protein Cas10/Csm1 [Chloroflexus sp.]|uniref:type III-A CRISPR-associated protein Cas10/Csm1 n=1 Tax=Chloroflexus sp. TaxID=1904827 RepID=UPI002ADE58E6|nr:type III-A CRISPR-associated protein Cas10/Csm1 [Chloroflexus sp.]
MTHAEDPSTVAWQVLHSWTLAALGERNDAVSESLRESAWRVVGQQPQVTWPPLQPALSSVFTRLRAGVKDCWQPPAMLRCREEVLFPKATAQPPSDELKQALQSGLAAAQRETDPSRRLERLLITLQRYAWAWPSPLPGVSLYDLARLHAAVQAAQSATTDGLICLLGGDLSGLQEFLYSIPAAGAARQLRGRSFYLQLLTEACAYWVLRNSRMPLCNLLYAGGGRFYAVLPGSVATQVLEWRRHLGHILLQSHDGSLYLALGSTRPFAPEQYTDETWRELSEAIDHDKRRRFAALDDSEFARMFRPRPPRPPRSDGSDAPDALGESLAELGRQLTRAAVLEVNLTASQSDGATWRRAITALGVDYRLIEESSSTKGSVSSRRLLALNDDVVQQLTAEEVGAIGQRYTVTEAYRLQADDLAHYREIDSAQASEIRVGDVAPFNLLAHLSDGVPRIAVLRMDVDNLGDLFGKGLQRPAGMGGLAVTAALSSALSRFFEGWVGELCRRRNQQGKGGIYAVYSGGDDLFLVGSWHLIPELAQQIRDDFIRYTTGAKPTAKPPVSLSAGITLHQAGYPLYQAAEDAGNALDAAKAYRHPDGRSKDAITFLGQTLSWDAFAQAACFKDKLLDLIAEGAPRGLLMTIQRMALLSRTRYNRDGAAQLTVGPWVWQGAYQLTRMADRSPESIRSRVVDLREQLISPEAIMQRMVIPAGLAARWAQLLLRGSK